MRKCIKMKIDRIEYQKNYNILGMQWEKIIVGGTLEDGDNFQDCIKELRAECDAAAQTKIDALYPHHAPHVVETPAVVEPEIKLTDDQKLQNTLDGIEKCKTLKELNDWRLIAKIHPDTGDAFNKKENELNLKK